MSKEEIKRRVQQVASTLPHAERIQKISLFGSQLHADATYDSDIDLLLEVSRPFTLFHLVHIQNALQETLDNSVDLVTPEFLSPYFRDNVLNEAEVLYERG